MQFGFGAGILFGTRNDIANGSPIRFGALQDVSVDFSGEVKELYGQSQYALDAASGKRKITAKAKFAQISANIMANMFFGTAATAGSIQTAYNEADSVSAIVTGATNAVTASGNTLHFASTPTGVAVGASITDTTTSGVIAAGTYVVSKTGTTVVMSAAVTAGGVLSADVINFGPSLTVTNSSNYAGDLGVTYASTGIALIYVPSNPAVGQYSEVGGTYSFNVADASANVLVSYLWNSSMAGYTILGGNPFMGTTPKFQATFNQLYGGNGTTLTLYSCVANKLTFPTKIDDYVIQEFDFMAYANAAGQTFSLSMAQ